ncbi:MAG: HAD family hydrolase [Steroidobacteraceae bacterium]
MGLSTWNGGAAKSAITGFVARVTEEGGADFLPPPGSVAVFDNDGTIWCEQPAQAQVFFAQARLRELAAKDPSMKERQPFKAFLEHDLQAIHALGKQAVFEMAFATHAGVTEEAFDAIARDWLGSAKHPKLGRRFPELAYRPQLELLDYLRSHGFQIFIVSGGGIGLIRAFSEEAYGIPRSQVVGSSLKARFEVVDGRAQLVRASEMNSFDDRETKVVNIGLHIGRRPILAFGNSDGDLAMMRYAKSGNGPSLALLLLHDDAEREFAYDREFRLSPLTEALDKAGEYGITVVSMKNDWKSVFPS